MLPAFENLLTALAEPCGMMKAFLFDVGTKIYVASDSSDVDMQVSFSSFEFSKTQGNISCS